VLPLTMDAWMDGWMIMVYESVKFGWNWNVSD